MKKLTLPGLMGRILKSTDVLHAPADGRDAGSGSALTNAMSIDSGSGGADLGDNIAA